LSCTVLIVINIYYTSFRRCIAAIGRGRRPDSVEGSFGILKLENEDSLLGGEDNGVFEVDEFCNVNVQRKINIAVSIQGR